MTFAVKRTTKGRVYRDLLAAIGNPAVHGVLIYYPCWRKRGAECHPEDTYLMDSVPIEKVSGPTMFISSYTSKLGDM